MLRGELVGLAMAIPPGLPSDLNRQLLFVDRLGIVGLDDVTETDDGLQRTWPYEPSHILRLRDAGVAISLPSRLPAQLRYDPLAAAALESAARASRLADRFQARLPRHISEVGGQRFNEALDRYHEQISRSRSYVARAFAIAARLSQGLDTVSLLPIAEERLSGEVARDEALRIVISSLPLPRKEVPPLEIVRFREDPENRERLLALRAWASRVARGKVTAVELREELESLVAGYTSALQRLERKYDVGTLELVVTGIPEAIAALATGGWVKAAGTLFSLTNAHTRLLEEEAALPGREVSYIVSTERRFA